MNDRLESVKRRIKLLRDALEDESTLSEISIDGVTEKFDRASMRAELRELEEEEARLEALASGRNPRLFGIYFR